MPVMSKNTRLNTPDPLLAPPQSMPASPLLADEEPPLRPSLLEVNPTKRRMENLDTLRIVCMLAIIITHITEPYIDRASNYNSLYRGIFSLNVACRFGVPCFLMISFFIYWHQLYDKGRSWGELLARRLKRLIPAFLVWSLIYVVLHRLLKRTTGDAHSATPWIYDMGLTNWRFWREIVLLGRAETHLYYLPMVITCLLLIPLLKLLWKPAAVSWTFLIGMLTAWVVVYYGSCIYGPDTAIGQPLNQAVSLWQNIVAIPLLVFPVVGMMSAGQRSWREWIARTPTTLWIGILLFGFALHVVETLWLLHYADQAATKSMQEHRWLIALAGLKPGRFVSAVAVFVLFLRSPLMRDPFPKVSHHAFGLHFMHPVIILGLSFIETRLFSADVWDRQAWIVPMLAVNFVITFFITFGLCFLIGRFKRLEFLVV